MRLAAAAEACDQTGAGEEDEREGPQDAHTDADRASKTGSISSVESSAGICARG